MNIVFCLICASAFGQEKDLFIIFSDSNYVFVIDYEKFAGQSYDAENSLASENFEVDWANSYKHVGVNDSIVIGEAIFYFSDVLRACYYDKKILSIEDLKSSEPIRFKRKRQETYRNIGIGGSGEKRLILIDRKTKKVLIDEIVSVNLAC